MAYENIQITQDNFCIAPLVGTYASVDTANASAYLRIKNDTGGSAASYTFNPNIAQGTVVYGLEYVGPRGVSSVKKGMAFFTLESNVSFSCTVKKWNLNVVDSRLDLAYSYTKTSSTNDKYVCSNFSVDRRSTTFYQTTTTTGIGYVTLSSVEDIYAGSLLYLGLSANGNNVGAFEEVEVTSVSGSTVFIKTATYVPPAYYYNSGDLITVLGRTCLFSDSGYAGDTNKGTLFVLDSVTGNVISRGYSGLYLGINATGYPPAYQGTVAVAKAAEMFYVRLTDFQIQKSHRINNILPDRVSYIDIKDFEQDNDTIYRLQGSTVLRDNNGSLVQTTWATYNFQKDGISRFTDTISLYIDSRGILYNEEQVTINAVVRDQFGVGISGKVVTFAKVSGDANGTWGDADRQVTTDVNGVATITYTSGWYDPSTFTLENEAVVISATTDGSNVFTGSLNVWGWLNFRVFAKFIFGPGNSPYGSPVIKQKIDTLTTTNIVKQIDLFSSSLVTVNKSNFSISMFLKQLSSLSSSVIMKEKEQSQSTVVMKQLGQFSDTGQVDQVVISRHLTTGNQDTVQVAQYRFMLDMVPAAFSEKNNTSTTVWVKLAPYGYSLNQSTLVFKVRELSYAGDTGYINYEGTQYINIVTFDAGGGMLGLEITFTPPSFFHNDALVYIYLSLFDQATPANKLYYDYWFKVIADYNAPYIINEFPTRNAYNVDKGTNIYFDVVDNEVGIDITSLEFYINNRIKPVEYTTISGGYHVEYLNPGFFYYNQPVEVSIKIQDSSGEANILYDMWHFVCEESKAPIVDSLSVIPKACERGNSSRTTKVAFNIYDAGDGIDIGTMHLLVDGKECSVVVTPIIQRTK